MERTNKLLGKSDYLLAMKVNDPLEKLLMGVIVSRKNMKEAKHFPEALSPFGA